MDSYLLVAQVVGSCLVAPVVDSFLVDLVDSHLEMSYLVEVSPLVGLSHRVEEDLYPVVDSHQAMVDSDLEESHLAVELEGDL